MKKALVIVPVALVAAAVAVYFLIPDARDETEGLTSALVGAPGQPEAITLDTSGLTELAITSDNTSVGFSCAKTLAGKTLVMRGGWSGKFGSELQGTIGVDPVSHTPFTLSAKARIDSLWSEHDQLTEALLTKGFFSPEAHPWAAFEGKIIPSIKQPTGKAGDSGEELTVAGNFTLNGITKRIEFPATVIRSDKTLTLASKFSLDRKAFDVNFTDEGGFGLLTDEDIAHKVAITLNIELPLDTEPTDDGTTVAEADPDAETNDTGAQDSTENWPTTFTETIPATQVDFEMVMVPSDPATGTQPFYIGKHEVTWDEFMPWVQGKDLDSEEQVGEERALKLRPSAPYGSVDRNFGMYRRPALSMSRKSAELYCQWLSEQTGRPYRLPTETEWEHAYTMGGSDPKASPSMEDADLIATYDENAWDDSIGDWATTQIGKREPNTLGIHDMAGNVAEWVTDTGDERVVRGGHFESPLDELGVGRLVEDMDEWNRDYPNEPKSQWWYVNARWVGLRVVCDAPPSVSDASE